MYIHLPNRFSTFWLLVVPLLMFYPVFAGEGLIIGAPISDLSNGLWSLWYVSQAFWGAGEPFCHQQVNAPVGGCLLPSDWTGLVWMLPLSMILNPIQSFNLTLYAQTVWTGFAMYLLFSQRFSYNWVRQMQFYHSPTSRRPCRRKRPKRENMEKVEPRGTYPEGGQKS